MAFSVKGINGIRFPYLGDTQSTGAETLYAPCTEPIGWPRFFDYPPRAQRCRRQPEHNGPANQLVDQKRHSITLLDRTFILS